MVVIEPCTDETSITLSEAVKKIEKAACEKKYQSDRVARLKKFRRNLREVAPYTKLCLVWNAHRSRMACG